MRKRAFPLLFILIVLIISYHWFNTDQRTNHPSANLNINVPDESQVQIKQSSVILDQNFKAEEPEHSVISSAETPIGVNVIGQVVDEFGDGINGIEIKISQRSLDNSLTENYSSTTDDTGYFVFEKIPPSKIYRLEALPFRGYIGTKIDPFPITDEMSEVKITLDSVVLSSAEGIAVNTDYNPLIGFEFFVQNVGVAYPGVKLISDSSGFFRVDDFPVGDLHLYTIGDNHFQITGITLQPNEYPI